MVQHYLSFSLPPSSQQEGGGSREEQREKDKAEEEAAVGDETSDGAVQPAAVNDGGGSSSQSSSPLPSSDKGEGEESSCGKNEDKEEHWSELTDSNKLARLENTHTKLL